MRMADLADGFLIIGRKLSKYSCIIRYLLGHEVAKSCCVNNQQPELDSGHNNVVLYVLHGGCFVSLYFRERSAVSAGAALAMLCPYINAVGFLSAPHLLLI